MAIILVRSTDGSDSDDGSTWALAKATLAGAAAIDAAGDTVAVSPSHAESTAASVTLAWAGTPANPTLIVCTDDAADPPTAESTGATVSTTGSSSITMTGSFIVKKLTFTAGSSAGTAPLSLSQTTGGGRQVFEGCYLRIGGANSSNRIVAGAAGTPPNELRLVNTWVRFAAAAQGFSGKGSNLDWRGGGVESGGTAITTALFRNGNDSSRVTSQWRAAGCDLSSIGTACAIWEAGTNATRGLLIDSKLPASWTGSLITGTLLPGDRVEMHNCDSADTHYTMWIVEYCGSILHETTIVRSGGASDGTTPLSWKMVSNSSAKFPQNALATIEIVPPRNTSVGSAITADIEVVTDGVTLKDDECWIDVLHLGASGSPLGVISSSAKADVLATGTSWPTSSETWTTTGLSSPVKQTLSVTFTPQEEGFHHLVVKLAKASTTIYVCPKVTLS